VVCTSGPGTAREADVGKVQAMRAGMGPDGALALASGVSESNVAGYLPHVDAYLVGTSIEIGFGILDPRKTARLHQLVAAYPG
jgi:predicted TIM-barrel enzyme